QDDAIRARVPSRSEGREHRPRVQGQLLAHELADRSKDVPVRSRLRDHQDDPIDAAVPHLELEAPRDPLEVADPRLGFDPDPESVDGDQGIPSTEVTRDRQRYLRREGQSWEDPTPEAADTCDLRPVSRRVVCRIELDRRIESQHDAELDDIAERHAQTA